MLRLLVMVVLVMHCTTVLVVTRAPVTVMLWTHGVILRLLLLLLLLLLEARQYGYFLVDSFH